jgi:DNA-directed RNA polymerase specialized sigma24 family protein
MAAKTKPELLDLAPTDSRLDAANTTGTSEHASPPAVQSGKAGRAPPRGGSVQPIRMPTQAQRESLLREMALSGRKLSLHVDELVARGHRNHGVLPGGDEGDDLLQEASMLLSSGQRHWPEHLEPRVMLKMTMLQLAGNRWRSPEAREVSLDRITETPFEGDREDSESDLDAVELMESGGSDFTPSGTDDEEVADSGAIPGTDGQVTYGLNPEELLLCALRERELLELIDSVLKRDTLAKEVVRSILRRTLKRHRIAAELGITITAAKNALDRLRRRLQPFVVEWAIVMRPSRQSDWLRALCQQRLEGEPSST